MIVFSKYRAQSVSVVHLVVRQQRMMNVSHRDFGADLMKVVESDMIDIIKAKYPILAKFPHEKR